MDISALIQGVLSAVILNSIIIGVFVHAIRSTFVYFFPKLEKNHHFCEAFLPTAPYIVGIMAALIFNHYQWQGIDWKQAIVAAALSSYSYRLLMAYVHRATIEQEKEDAAAAKKEAEIADNIKP